jgi:hypothetical protein
MYAPIKGLVAGFAILGLAACGDANQPLVPPGELAATSHGGSLQFSVTSSHSVQFDQTATGARRAIEFTGSVTTGTPCYNVTADHETVGSDVTLTVTATDTGEPCILLITYQNYEGKISGLAAGTYEFTVVHDVNGDQTVAYQDTVTVS